MPLRPGVKDGLVGQCSFHRLAIGSGAATHSPEQLSQNLATPLRYSLVRQGVAAMGAADGSCLFPSLRGSGAVGFSADTIEIPAAALEACFSISACFAAMAAFICFSISACFATMAACICFAIAAFICFAMAAFTRPAAACIAPLCSGVAWLMRALMVERADLASAGVELAAERPSVTTAAQARRKARFVGMGCLHCDLRTLVNSPPPQCDSNHSMCFFLDRTTPQRDHPLEIMLFPTAPIQVTKKLKSKKLVLSRARTKAYRPPHPPFWILKICF